MKPALTLVPALAALLLGACERVQDKTVIQIPSAASAALVEIQVSAPLPVSAPQINTGIIDDAALTAQVKAALAADAGLRTFKLDVDSKQGSVTISGTVKDQETATLVVRAAQGVPGVTAVHSQLTIKP